MIDFAFYCRASKADRNGLSPIEVSITINKKRKIIQLERKEKASEYAKMSGSKKNNDIKVYIDMMRNKLNSAVVALEMAGEDITPDSIKEYIRNDGFKVYTIGEVIDAFLKMQHDKVESKECTEGVYKKYVIITNHFLNHINRYVEIRCITESQIESFYSKMKKIYVDATLSGQMYRLKSVFNYAVKNKMLKVSPFNIEIKKAKAKEEYLEDNEMELLRHAKIENESLDKIRELALFQAASGVAYADLVQLVKDDLKVSENGYKYIHKERQKTGIFFTAVLLPDAIRIWDKYDGDLPIISNQKYNMYLKILADVVGIKKTLHTHIFRKTYATTLLNEGVRIDVVSKACGHSNTRITATTYAFLKKKTIVDEIANTVVVGA